MENNSTTSDVNYTRRTQPVPPCAGLTSNALPEALSIMPAESSQTGVSTRNALYRTTSNSHKEDDAAHWYALRTTYGREKKAYDYLVEKNIKAFYPMLKRVKIINGERVVKEESRIPNMFFAYGTEEEIKTFVYDNVNLPFLRFYYRHSHIGNTIVKIPLIVPDSQMNSLIIVCTADSEDVVASTEDIQRFKEGQKVRIIDGKFKGVVGNVARYQSQQRVGIVIEGILTVCTAYIPSAFIVPIE